MKSALKALIAGLLLSSTMASAAVVQVGSITRNYGTSGTTPASMPAGTCDTLNSNSVTIRDTGSGCQRFYDMFDFGAMQYGSLDRLVLTLSFSNTNNLLEDWKVRFAQSPTVAVPTAGLINMNEVGSAGTTQSFTLNFVNGGSVFTTVAANEKMYLWFSEEGFGAHNFTLSSARLDVYGTALPEPAGMALFGIALGALGVARRRRTR